MAGGGLSRVWGGKLGSVGGRDPGWSVLVGDVGSVEVGGGVERGG